MLQFYLSKTLASDMSHSLGEPLAAIPGAMQWYGHRVTVFGRTYVLIMELQSRYCMLFSNLTELDFENFNQLFVDRLWRKTVSICSFEAKFKAVKESTADAPQDIATAATQLGAEIRDGLKKVVRHF